MDGNGNMVDPEGFWNAYNAIYGSLPNKNQPPMHQWPQGQIGPPQQKRPIHPLVAQQLFGGGGIKGGPQGMSMGGRPGMGGSALNRGIDVDGDGDFDMTLSDLIQRMKGLHSQARDPIDASTAAQVFAQLQKLGAERHKQRQQAMNVPAQYRAMSRGG